MDYLCLQSWAGRSETPVRIIATTPKRYRIELLDDSMKGKRGTILLVPQYAIKHTDDDDAEPTTRYD